MKKVIKKNIEIVWFFAILIVAIVAIMINTSYINNKDNINNTCTTEK